MKLSVSTHAAFAPVCILISLHSPSCVQLLSSLRSRSLCLPSVLPPSFPSPSVLAPSRQTHSSCTCSLSVTTPAFETHFSFSKFKDGVPKESILQSLLNGFQSGSAVTYSYGPVFNGIAAKLVGADLTFVQRAANVESIEQDSILSISYE
jgi:hypothetical protein